MRGERIRTSREWSSDCAAPVESATFGGAPAPACLTARPGDPDMVLRGRGTPRRRRDRRPRRARPPHHQHIVDRQPRRGPGRTCGATRAAADSRSEAGGRSPAGACARRAGPGERAARACSHRSGSGATTRTGRHRGRAAACPTRRRRPRAAPAPSRSRATALPGSNGGPRRACPGAGSSGRPEHRPADSTRAAAAQHGRVDSRSSHGVPAGGAESGARRSRDAL